MANKKAKKENNKNLMIGACVAVLAVAVVIVAVVFATRGPQLNDAYFVSDNAKYVLTVDGSIMNSEGLMAEYIPVESHVVYDYSGDSITHMTIYLVYADDATANSAFKVMEEVYTDQDLTEYGIKNFSNSGKYLIVEMAEDQYADLKASDIKQQIDLMEMMKNMDAGDIEETNETVEINE